jgi:hypothetical protein
MVGLALVACGRATLSFTGAGPAVAVPIERVKPVTSDGGAGPMINLPTVCRACGGQFLLENLFVDDGCPCNSARGVNLVPQRCEVCKVDDCVKPGHRLAALFGPHVAAGATP